MGVVLGAAVLVALPEIFRDLQAYRLLAFGLLLMVLMVFRPEGLLPVHGRPTKPQSAAPPTDGQFDSAPSSRGVT